jgi:hypothetical protein
MGNGVISENDLMSKLSNAKKIMNSDVKPSKKNKINNMNYDDENLNINENISYSDPEGLLDMQQMVNIPRNTSTPSIEKINESRLPENIKMAMIERPIVYPDISLTSSLDMNLVQKAKKLMDDGGSGKQIQESRQIPKQSTNNININEIINALTPIVENTIRKVLDEKLTQILTAKDTASINENLVLKVGDSIFKGKITGVRPSK